MPDLTPTRRTVVRTAAWSVPAVTLVSAAPAFAATGNSTNLSTTTPVSPVRTAPNAVQMPQSLTFTNTGNTEADGADVHITSSIAISSITVDLTELGGGITDVRDVGIVITPSLPATDFIMTVPPGGFLIIPAGESVGLPLPLDLGLDGPGSVDMEMTVTGANAAGATNIPFISPKFTIA